MGIVDAFLSCLVKFSECLIYVWESKKKCQFIINEVTKSFFVWPKKQNINGTVIEAL